MSAQTTPSVPSADTGGASPRTLVRHTTTDPAPVHAFINTALPPINPGAPVELDSTPVSPVARKRSWKTPTTATAGGYDNAEQELSVDEDEDEDTKQKREELLQVRQKDPSVLVDIPNTPGPEEYGIAQAGLGAGIARRSSVTSVTSNEVAATVVPSAKT